MSPARLNGRRPPPGVLAIVAAVALAGCGTHGTSADSVAAGEVVSVTSADGTVVAEVESDTGIAVGTNELHVRLRPADATLVRVAAMMPVHGHATPVLPRVKAEADGYLVNDLVLTMAGLWEVTLTVKAGAATDEDLEFSVDVR